MRTRVLQLCLGVVLAFLVTPAAIYGQIETAGRLDCTGQALGIRIVPEWRGRLPGDDPGPVLWEAGLLEPCHVIVHVASDFDQILPANLREPRIVTFRSLVDDPFLIKAQKGTIDGRESVTLRRGESITLYFRPGSNVWRILDRYPSGCIFADNFEAGNTSAWGASRRPAIGVNRDR